MITAISPGLAWFERLALAVYDLLMHTLQPLLRLKLRRRAQYEPGYAFNTAERFGHYTGDSHDGGFVWLHAVSLGETRAAALILPTLRSAFPGLRFLLTHSTATGLAQGRALLEAGDVQAWLPWDTAQATRQFLLHFKPRIGLLMETEVWPNLVQACRCAEVSLCLLNARMSEKSCRQALRWSMLSGPAYRGLSLVLAQSVSDAHRLQRMGCFDVRVVGNLKFDVTVTEQARMQASLWHTRLSARPVVMLASTREGEEALWLQALQSDPARLKQFKSFGVLWLVVPRHPQRFDEVYALIKQAGWSCIRKSAWDDQEPDATLAAHADVLLGDSVGEMQSYYLVSRLALLGGSFAPLGGQNLIEAAACACPVVMGPYTFNFTDAAASAVEQGAAVRVPHMQAALDQVVFALAHPQWLDLARAATAQLMEIGRGAGTNHMTALRTLMPLVTEGVSRDV